MEDSANLENLEKLLREAVTNSSLGEKLLKGDIDVKSEFGLSDEEIMTLESFRTGLGLKALLNFCQGYISGWANSIGVNRYMNAKLLGLYKRSLNQ